MIAMRKRLLICGHPDLSRSRFSSGVLSGVDREIFDLHVLAEHPAHKSFDAGAEIQRLARASDLLLLFPLHWYGPPSILVRWMEEALPTSGDLSPARALYGKEVGFLISTGGDAAEYSATGKNERPVFEYLHPVLMTFKYFGARVRRPTIFHSAWRMAPEAAHDVGRALCTRRELDRVYA
jgi:glutathione-regulated potassium-efflux system ancillary protein KefG